MPMIAPLVHDALNRNDNWWGAVSCGSEDLPVLEARVDRLLLDIRNVEVLLSEFSLSNTIRGFRFQWNPSQFLLTDLVEAPTNSQELTVVFFLQVR